MIVTLTPHKWHHVCVSHSQPYLKRSRAKVYFDGALVHQPEVLYPSAKELDACVVALGTAGESPHPSLVARPQNCFRAFIDPLLVLPVVEIGSNNFFQPFCIMSFRNTSFFVMICALPPPSFIP